MPELSGGLEGIGLGPLLSFLVSLPGGGELSITDASTGFTGVVSLRDGRVVGATCGEEIGVAAVEAIGLVLSRGRFTFTEGGDVAQPNLTLAIPELAEQIERLDRESARLAALIPSLSAVPCVASFSDTDEVEGAIDLRTVRLLLRIDGRRSVADLGRQYGLTTTMQRLAELIELGVVEIEPGPERTAGRPLVVSSAPRAPQPPKGPQLEPDTNGTTHPVSRSPWARLRGPEASRR